LLNGFPANQAAHGCFATIIQNNGPRYYQENVDPGITFAYTKMLNDAGIESVAVGMCWYDQNGNDTAFADTVAF
jgi:hypothetical protein